jgi:hypothetical protein
VVDHEAMLAVHAQGAGRAIVDVVAVLVVLISIVPVYLAHRLTREEGGVASARAGRGRIEGGGVETEATTAP